MEVGVKDDTYLRVDMLDPGWRRVWLEIFEHGYPYLCWRWAEEYGIALKNYREMVIYRLPPLKL